MHFYFTRLLNALKTHGSWLFLALIPLAVYLVASPLFDRTATVARTFSYSGNVLVAKNPVSSVDLEDLIAKPDLLFQEGFALTDLSRQGALLQDAGYRIHDIMDLRRLVYRSLTLSKTGDSELRLAYEGPREPLGRHLVDYYSERLLARFNEALQHAKQQPGVTAPSLEMGTLKVSSRPVLWRPERLPPALWILALSLLAMTVIIAAREFSDPSFRSERQIARYLGLPILGTIPDAAPLAKRLNHQTDMRSPPNGTTGASSQTAGSDGV
ncbi:hypothetical protein [Imhoffiella purpurea]|uniref:Uncharacterized protein n=1 Tax=Imhoffiella purpurea TaxID=1249627 RepID=W9V6U9_9GAMM|nr:hypothetical protein [Imhoffiella purpurea]EXJ15129.1 hypothetical protein D779_1683 [Imhoffiella purpurea]